MGFFRLIAAGSAPDFYAKWVPLAAQHKARLILDTRGEPLKLAMQQGEFIMKLNREELAATLGTSLESDADVMDAARSAAPAGGAAIVTLGARGAIASDGKRVWRVTPPKVKAISAVGSGDAFAAGLAFGLTRGDSLPDAMALGSACGAANAITALAGHLSLRDVNELRRQVEVAET